MCDQLTEALAEAGPASRPLWNSLFGVDEERSVARLLTQFVSAERCDIERVRFLHHGVGLVAGLDLADASAVVLKVHRWRASIERLSAVQQMQRELADADLPAPRPLAAPTVLGSGVATIDEFLAGDAADGHDSRVRGSMARMLASFHRAGRAVATPGVLGAGAIGGNDEPSWGEPHDLRFDFDRTAAGAEWIDELAASAASALRACDLPVQVSHLDWRVENLGFGGHDVVAIYDWDSVALAPEAVAVGQAAAQFSTDWRRGVATLPTPAEVRGFVADYERERGRRFDDAERTMLQAATVALCAYGARCEHSDRVLHPDLAPPSGSGWDGLLTDLAGSAL